MLSGPDPSSLGSLQWVSLGLAGGLWVCPLGPPLWTNRTTGLVPMLALPCGHSFAPNYWPCWRSTSCALLLWFHPQDQIQVTSSLVYAAGESAFSGSDVGATVGSQSPSSHGASLLLHGLLARVEWGKGPVLLFLPGGTYHPGRKTTGITWPCSHRAVQRA